MRGEEKISDSNFQETRTKGILKKKKKLFSVSKEQTNISAWNIYWWGSREITDGRGVKRQLQWEEKRGRDLIYSRRSRLDKVGSQLSFSPAIENEQRITSCVVYGHDKKTKLRGGRVTNSRNKGSKKQILFFVSLSFFISATLVIQISQHWLMLDAKSNPKGFFCSFISECIYLVSSYAIWITIRGEPINFPAGVKFIKATNFDLGSECLL